MISISHNFLFIHIPKTAGNSIQNILRHFSEDRIVILAPYQDGVERFEVRSAKYRIEKHSRLIDYQNQLEPDLYKRLFKFCVIRNPWDRCISFYFSPHRGNVSWDRQAFISFLNYIPPMLAYLVIKNESNQFVYSNENVNYVMRFENLDYDFKYVSSLIRIPYTRLPHRNKSNREDYRKYYDKELIEIVRKKYELDIQLFGYEF